MNKLAINWDEAYAELVARLPSLSADFGGVAGFERVSRSSEDHQAIWGVVLDALREEFNPYDDTEVLSNPFIRASFSDNVVRVLDDTVEYAREYWEDGRYELLGGSL